MVKDTLWGPRLGLGLLPSLPIQVLLVKISQPLHFRQVFPDHILSMNRISSLVKTLFRDNGLEPKEFGVVLCNKLGYRRHHLFKRSAALVVRYYVVNIYSELSVL